MAKAKAAYVRADYGARHSKWPLVPGMWRLEHAVRIRSATCREVARRGPELPVEWVAASSATISYDLTCGMTRRVLFVEDDK